MQCAAEMPGGAETNRWLRRDRQLMLGGSLLLAVIDLLCVAELLLVWWPGEVVRTIVIVVAFYVTLGEVVAIWHYLVVRRLLRLMSTPLPVTPMVMTRVSETHAGASQWGAWATELSWAELWYPERAGQNALRVRLYTPVTSTGRVERVEVLGTPKRGAWLLLHVGGVDGGFLLPDRRAR